MDTYTSGLLLVVVGWAGVVGLLMYIYRRRRAAREREREARYQQMIGVTLGARAPGGAALPDVAGAARAAVAAVRPAAAGNGSGARAPVTSPAAGLASSGAAGIRRPDPAAPVRASPEAREQALRMADALLAMRPGSGPTPDAAAAPTAAATPMRVRAPLLEAPARAMLLALRAAAPGHEILIGPSLARLLDAPPGLSGVDRSLRLRQAAGHTVDFALCTRGLELVATIDLLAQGLPAGERESRRASAAQLEAAGIRHLVFDPAQLPRYPELRALIGLDTPRGER
jgi:hypothetical protein